MSHYKFGDIILLKFPFTDVKKFKKRPALMLKDTNDGDVILARITSKKRISEYDVEIENWKQVGLMLSSVVRIHKIATLDKKLIDLKIGNLESKELKNIKRKITEFFENI